MTIITTSSKALAKHRALRLANNPAALSLEAVLELVDQLRGMASDCPAVVAFLDAVSSWAIARRDRRILDNMGLVYSAVRRRYCYALETLGIPEDDASQEGLMGLMRAAVGYDESRGIAFSTYATLWIKLYIGRLLESDTTVRVPAHIQQQARNAAKKSGESYSTQRCLSLDLVWGEEDSSLANMAVDKSAPGVIRHSDARSDLKPLLDSLRPKERLLIECRYLRNLTLVETAAELHRVGLAPLTTRERVRQLEAEVLRIMRERAKMLRGIQGSKRRLA